MHNKSDRIANYQKTYLDNIGFERVMIKYRQQQIMETLARIAPSTVIEVGCGEDLLCTKYIASGQSVKQWIIVEPGKQFAAVARTVDSPGLIVINNFLEDAVWSVQDALLEEPDIIICSSVMHEVPNLQDFVASLRKLMGSSSLLYVNVPNALSLHRRLAKSMGLIRDVADFSQRNVELNQHRVFSPDSLRKVLQESGFSIKREGGYFVKPFTHVQMESINETLSGLYDGLYRLGQEMPEIASEIFAEACLASACEGSK